MGAEAGAGGGRPSWGFSAATGAVCLRLAQGAADVLPPEVSLSPPRLCWVLGRSTLGSGGPGGPASAVHGPRGKGAGGTPQAAGAGISVAAPRSSPGPWDFGRGRDSAGRGRRGEGRGDRSGQGPRQPGEHGRGDGEGGRGRGGDAGKRESRGGLQGLPREPGARVGAGPGSRSEEGAVDSSSGGARPAVGDVGRSPGGPWGALGRRAGPAGSDVAEPGAALLPVPRSAHGAPLKEGGPAGL